MELEIKKYLFDIHESIDSIEKYLGKKRDFKIYMADKIDIEIIWGTIVRHLPTLKKEIELLLIK
jgi:uncharacterized protein with HEPN domain